MVSGCVGRLVGSTRRSVKARSRNVGRANKQGPGDDYKADYAQVRGMSSEARAGTDYAQVRGMSSEARQEIQVRV